MRAIILAAGIGTRLQPYTNSRPKCLVEVLGKPLLEHQLSILKKNRILDIICVGGYLHQQLFPYFKKVELNKEYETTNMVETLFSASNYMSETCIISYGDIVYSSKILKQLKEDTSNIGVIVDDNWKSYWEDRSENPLDDAETLKIVDKNRIAEIGGKAVSLSEIESQYIGLIKLTPLGSHQLLKVYEAGKKSGKLNGKNYQNAYLTDLLQEAISAGIEVNSIRTRELWVEIDTVDDLENEVTTTRLQQILND